MVRLPCSQDPLQHPIFGLRTHITSSCPVPFRFTWMWTYTHAWVSHEQVPFLIHFSSLHSCHESNRLIFLDLIALNVICKRVQTAKYFIISSISSLISLLLRLWSKYYQFHLNLIYYKTVAHTASYKVFVSNKTGSSPVSEVADKGNVLEACPQERQPFVSSLNWDRFCWYRHLP